MMCYLYCCCKIKASKTLDNLKQIKMVRVNKTISQCKETGFIKKKSKFGEEKSFNMVIVSFPNDKIQVYIKL